MDPDDIETDELYADREEDDARTTDEELRDRHREDAKIEDLADAAQA